MEGRVIAGDPERLFDGVAIDSRVVRGGELFFALAGTRSDGHLYLADAVERGAAGVVIHRQDVEVPEGGAAIQVGDTFAALHDLTRAVRARVPRRLVAITGSTGKTTTKEILAAILARRFQVARSPGNLNNLYGFPLALLNIPDETEWMVAEMGMSTPGELAQISLLGRPDVALFTNVRPAHLEGLGTLAAVAEAKAELLAGLAPHGLVVANADDPWVAWIARRHSGRTVWYGLGSQSPSQVQVQVRGRDVQPLPAGEGSRFRLEAEGIGVDVDLPLYGLYNVENCLAAAACAWALGVSLEEIREGVTQVVPAAHRGVVHRLSGQRILVDDSYNSNPSALSRALESAARIPARRRWAVLGDMLELGPEGPRYHQEAGEEAARLGFSPVVGVGEISRELVAGAQAAGAQVRWFPDARSAAVWAPGEFRPGDLVLVKGSRGVGLEAVVEELLAGGRED